MTCSATDASGTQWTQWLADAPFESLRGVSGRVTGLFESVTAANAGQFTCLTINGAVYLYQSVKLVVVPARSATPPAIYQLDTHMVV